MRGAPLGCRDHLLGQVDPDAVLNPIGKGSEVRAVATPDVQDCVGRGELGVAIENTQPVPQQHVGTAVPIGRVGGQRVKKVAEVIVIVSRSWRWKRRHTGNLGSGEKRSVLYAVRVVGRPSRQ